MVSRKPTAPNNVQAVEQSTELPTRMVNDGQNNPSLSPESEKIKQFINELMFDIRDLENFYNISISPTRVQRLGEYLTRRMNQVSGERLHMPQCGSGYRLNTPSQVVTGFSFDDFDQEGKIDW